MAAGSVTRIWSVDITVNGRGSELAVGIGAGRSPGVRHPVRSSSRAATASTPRARAVDVSIAIELLQHSRHGRCIQVSKRLHVQPPRRFRNLHSVGYRNDECACGITGATAGLGILQDHAVSCSYTQGRTRLLVRLRVRLTAAHLIPGNRDLEGARGQLAERGMQQYPV